MAKTPELIDRQAALKKMCETCGYCEKFEKAMRSTHPDFVTDKCNNYKFLAEQPTIEAEPVRHGQWIMLEPYGTHHTHRRKCSECGEIKTQELTSFCPNCGAKMDGGADECPVHKQIDTD